MNPKEDLIKNQEEQIVLDKTIVATTKESFAATADTAAVIGEKRSTRLPRGINLGQIFANRFRIDAVLGVGGMGLVLAAHDIEIDRDVAIKVLLPGKGAEAKYLQRFQQEALTVSKLNYPSIVKVFDFGLDAKTEYPYLVMQKVDGEPLSQILKRCHTMSESEASKLVAMIAEALQHAHNNGVIHRDIKPSNILVKKASDGSISNLHIVDFGIARLREKEDGQLTLTKTGEIFGSPEYMSPEQSLGKPVSEATDIYSLGCVLYECLVGKSPYTRESAVETLIAHIQGAAPTFEGKQVSQKMQNIILKALEVDPLKRFAAMEDFGNAVHKKKNVKASFGKRLSYYRQKFQKDNSYKLLAFAILATVSSATFFTINAFIEPEMPAANRSNYLKWYERAITYKENGKLDKYRQALIESNRLQPLHIEGAFQLARLYMQSNENDKAQKTIEQIKQVLPANRAKEFAQISGFNYFSLDQPEKARTSLLDVLKIDSTDYYALSYLAKLEYAAGNNDKGTDYLTRAFASNKEEALKNSEGLLDYLENKNLAEAKKAASAIVDSYRKAVK
ncbi:MAG: Non-specific serine/threonine protein kinase [Cyanobacteriota bacterium erpe_2018_sw_39hr_WHONDRS-SW48-000098_B_bin.30]|nr:Non-specific serine/threonine protein kinase [Cyanobacteriota bacterium erpe_2018_sw_39hr_WHONDRS-SW48-000098_B_bin.30]